MRIISPAIVLLLLLAIQGCGRKPGPVLPAQVTVEQVLTSLEKQMSQIHDFSGRARARARIEGESESAVIYINFIRPDRFRVIVKGTFGVVLSVVMAGPDYYTIYIPSISGYFIVGRDEDISELLVPGARFDISRLTSMFTGLLTSVDELADSHISLKRKRHQAVLTIENGDTVYRYTVEGPDILLMEEEISMHDVVIWRRTCADYEPCGSEVFPRKNTFTEGKKQLVLEFTSCTVNPGLTEDDLFFEIPPNAERYSLEQKSRPSQNTP